MRQLFIRIVVLTAILLAGVFRSNCQNEIPEVFKNGSIPEQLKYLDERTRIYENYRAIREDMYRIMSRNTLDTLSQAKKRMSGLILQAGVLETRIDSLQKSLETSKTELEEKTRTKNSIGLLGIELNKVTYNTIMWSVLGVLVFLLVSGYLTFRQNRSVTLKTKKDLNDLKAEFEEYRKKTRLEREKTAIDHFNEIKKLKGGR
jgi:uncharacterized membrane-anchored protein YhcB (DUF1043 family)